MSKTHCTDVPIGILFERVLYCVNSLYTVDCHLEMLYLLTMHNVAHICILVFMHLTHCIWGEPERASH